MSVMHMRLLCQHSLFEFLFDLQHQEICKFPSQHFYNRELKTANIRSSDELLDIWPRYGTPMVFCHVEGAEKSLSVSTAEGNEQSKSNEAEKEEAVSWFMSSSIHLIAHGSWKLRTDLMTYKIVSDDF